MLDLTKIKSAAKLDAKSTYGRLKERCEAKTLCAEFKGDEVVRVQKDVPGLVPATEIDPLPTPEQLKQLCEQRGVDWDERYHKGGKDHRMVRYWASDQRVDDDGDIVVQSWDFKRFEKNSPMPWAHAWRELPLGRYLTWKVADRNDGGYSGPALKVLGVFATPEVNPLAEEVRKMVHAGLLPGCSVGFGPIDVYDVPDPEERKQLGLGRYGLVFAHSGLIENSPCTVPANPGAVTFSLYKDAAARGDLTPSGMQILREIRRREALRTHDAERCLSESEQSLIRVARAIWPDHDWTAHKDVASELDLEAPRVRTQLLASDFTSNVTLTTDGSKNLVGTSDAVMTAIKQIKEDQDRLIGLVQALAKKEPDPQHRSTERAAGALDTRLARAIKNAEVLGALARNGETKR